MNGAATTFGRVKRSVRWPDWALSKIPKLCIVGSYMGLAHGQTSAKFLTDLLLFVFVFATSHSAYGFLVNDLGDREMDRRHGKRNTFLELGTKKGWALLAAVTAVMLLSGLPFVIRPGFVALWGLWWFVAVAYSLPPLRLKERGAVGIVVSSVAQVTVPVLITFAALGAGTRWERWIFILAMTLSGAVLELAHQRHDLRNDAQTGTLTLAVRMGQPKIDTVYSWALWLDRAAVGVVVAAVVLGSPPLVFKGHSTGLLTGLPLLFIYLAALWGTIARLRTGPLIDPYYGRRPIAERVLHDTLPNLFVPVFLLARLTWDSPIFVLGLVWFLVWRLWLPRIH